MNVYASSGRIDSEIEEILFSSGKKVYLFYLLVNKPYSDECAGRFLVEVWGKQGKFLKDRALPKSDIEVTGFLVSESRYYVNDGKETVKIIGKETSIIRGFKSTKRDLCIGDGWDGW